MSVYFWIGFFFSFAFVCHILSFCCPPHETHCNLCQYSLTIPFMMLFVQHLLPSLHPEVRIKCLIRPKLTSNHSTSRSYHVIGTSTVFPLLAASSQQLQPLSGWGGFPGARPKGPGTKSCSCQRWWGHELKLTAPQIEGMHNSSDTLRIWKGLYCHCYHLNSMLLVLHKLINPSVVKSAYLYTEPQVNFNLIHVTSISHVSTLWVSLVWHLN